MGQTRFKLLNSLVDSWIKIVFSLASIMLALLLDSSQASASKQFPVVRFKFTIDTKATPKELLPVPPDLAAAPFFPKTLEEVPEVMLEKPLRPDPRWRDLTKLSEDQGLELFKEILEGKNKAIKHTAHQVAKVNHLIAKNPDLFIETLCRNRPDLSGLPFITGDASRLSKERKAAFVHGVGLVRTALDDGSAPVPLFGEPDRPQRDLKTQAMVFWRDFQRASKTNLDQPRENVDIGCIAALMQMLAPESPELQRDLAKYLAGIEQQEATRALARLAVYSEDGEVRRLAIEGLKKRARVDFADILWEGLSYPWPTVATNAANAIAKLRHVDLVPKLVDLLEQPDPSAPVWREVQGKKVPVIRELVRINHHRNCLLCHPPGTNPEMRDGTPFASIPMPDLPLPSQSGGYFMMLSPDILVQIDTTYLRQDFSRYQKVPDAAPWPTLQRFDFLVRTRVLNSNELGQYRKLQEERKRSPHQEATLAALRGLTGLDAGVSADSWRQRINQAKNESTVGSGKGKD